MDLIWMASMLAALTASQAADTAVTPTYVESELRRLAADYAEDPMIVDATFGVEVDGNVWTIDATPGVAGRAARVTVTRGAPQVATWVDTLEGPVFRDIVEGRLSALTASVRGRPSEVTLMNPRMVNGMSERALDASGMDRAVLAHFWTTGNPEVVPFGFAGSNIAHGAHVSVLHYATGLRSAWWGIRPGQHVNADPADQANPFPTMFIVLRAGTVRARLGGREMALRDQTMIMIPPNMTHEFWNPGDQPGEGFIVMFGSGS